MSVGIGKVLAIGALAVEATEGRVLVALTVLFETKGALALAAKLVDALGRGRNRWSW
jgi:hypothetical protein